MIGGGPGVSLWVLAMPPYLASIVLSFVYITYKAIVSFFKKGETSRLEYLNYAIKNSSFFSTLIFIYCLTFYPVLMMGFYMSKKTTQDAGLGIGLVTLILLNLGFAFFIFSTPQVK